MALTVEQPPVNNKTIKWPQAIHGEIYRCHEGRYLVICNQSNQAVALSTAEGAKTLGDTWSPGCNSHWVPVNATLTVTGDE